MFVSDIGTVIFVIKRISITLAKIDFYHEKAPHSIHSLFHFHFMRN
jgi:hypothetical protein